jgi:hypothetical protein
MSTWEHVSSRLGNVPAATRSIAKEIFEAAQKAGHDIWFMWGMGTSQEHRTGRALDLMVRTNAAGDWVRNYVWTHRKRLRLIHVIWEQHITSTVTRPGVRVKMEDRGNPTANHFDHNHVWFFSGAYQPPSSSTPSSTILRAGSKGTSVRRVQRFLLNTFPAYRSSVRYMPGRYITVDGIYGRQTEAWVKEFQRRTRLSQTGQVDTATLKKLRQYGYDY